MISTIRDLFHQPYFICLLASFACGFFYYLRSEDKRIPRKLVWAAFILLFIAAFSTFAGAAVYRIYHPQAWDFACFHLYGKTAAAGENFYVPANFHQMHEKLQLASLTDFGFSREVLDVGFPYPPPTILYFLPLGFLSFKAGLIAWTLFNLCFVSGCIYLIYSMFLKRFGLNGFLLAGTLFFIFLPCISTINFAQTNFILLCYLLLMKRFEDKKFAGIFLALAMFTKPYMVVFGLYFLLRKRWGAILYCAGAVLALLGITFLIVGKAPFESYIFDNFVHRLPGWSFTEKANQSLHSTLLRNHVIAAEDSISFILIAGAILLATAGFLYYLLKKKLFDYIWPVLLLVALLIYPATLTSYGVLLLFILFQFFDEERPLGFNPVITIPVVIGIYLLSTISLFATICFLLTIIVLKTVKAPQPLRAFLLRTK